MKQKNLKWVYDESSNAYDLYFNPYNDSEPEPVATIAEDAGTWELANSLMCSNCFLNAESLEDAKNETMNLVEEYYQDKIDYYEQLLEEFDDARKETENEVADGALCEGTVNHKACGEEHRQLAEWLEEANELLDFCRECGQNRKDDKQ